MFARLLVCLAQIVIQHSPLPITNQAQTPKHSITGTVTNAATGEPIRRALVRLMGQTQASDLTGPDGRFRFEDVPEGGVIFNAQKPGFFDLPPDSTNNQRYTVGSGANDFALKLYPGARIVGRITDTDGEPVEGSNVQVFAEQIQQGRKQWQPRNGAMTDDDGTFRIDELTPGRYIVYCGGHALPAMTWNGPREVYAPAYFPDAKDRTSAQAVELQAGQEFMVDFRLRKELGYTVIAQVTGMANTMGGMPTIETESGQIVNFGHPRFDRAKGQFTVEGVPSGSWVVAIRGGDQKGHAYEARRDFTVDHADVNGLQLEAQLDATIPLTVSQAESSLNGNIQAQLISVDPARQGNYFAGLQGDPPTMRFMNVPAGRYRFTVRSFGNECLESATYGGMDLMRDELLVSANSETQPITVNLTSQCAVLKIGVKSESKNVAYVVVAPSSGADEPMIQTLMAQGKQQLRLPAGTYRVFAFSDLNGLEYANPEAMRNYPSQTITIGVGETQEVMLDVTERKDR